MGGELRSFEAEGAGDDVAAARQEALQALRELAGTLAEDDVEFVTVSEGERGLMGVGRQPARVLARARSRRPALGPVAERVRDVVERIAAAIDPELARHRGRARDARRRGCERRRHGPADRPPRPDDRRRPAPGRRRGPARKRRRVGDRGRHRGLPRAPRAALRELALEGRGARGARGALAGARADVQRGAAHRAPRAGSSTTTSRRRARAAIRRATSSCARATRPDCFT